MAKRQLLQLLSFGHFWNGQDLIFQLQKMEKNFYLLVVGINKSYIFKVLFSLLT